MSESAKPLSYQEVARARRLGLIPKFEAKGPKRSDFATQEEYRRAYAAYYNEKKRNGEIEPKVPVIGITLPPLPVYDPEILRTCPCCGDERRRDASGRWKCNRCRREKAAARRAPEVERRKQERQEQREIARQLWEAEREKRLQEHEYGIDQRKAEADRRKEEAFWALVEKTDNHWLWGGTMDEGSPYYSGRPARLRVFLQSGGKLHDGATVYRTCDEPRCVNPCHAIAQTEDERFGTFEERFMDKVQKADEGCWEWLGKKNSNGYGTIRKGRKNKAAHRIMFEIHHGTIDPSMGVHHLCDNPGCVNPDHLAQGDQKENMRQAVERNRTARGLANAAAKLTDDQVREMRAKWQNGTTVAGLAKEYGINKKYAREIVKGRARIYS